MFSRLLTLFVLLVLRVAEISAACQYTEYADTAIDSSIEAVAANVNTETGCLNFLDANQNTHSAVAFDANGKKCCSAMEGQNFALVYRRGWTTFVKLPNGTNANPTQKPSAKPTANTAPSNPGFQTTSSAQAYTYGVIYNNYISGDINKAVSVSVFSYNYDVCINPNNLNNLQTYQNNQRGTFYVTSYFAVGFEVQGAYDINSWGDYATLSSPYTNFQLTGTNYDYRTYLSGNYLYIHWYTDGSSVAKGFCFKIKPVATPPAWAQVSSPAWATSRDTSRIPIQSTSTNTQVSGAPGFTYGVLYNSFATVDINKPVSVSIYTYNYDMCVNPYNLNNLQTYQISQSGTLQLYSPYAAGFEVKGAYETEFGYDYVSVSSSYTPQIKLTGNGYDYRSYFSGNSLYISWNSDMLGVAKGFCFKITAVAAAPAWSQATATPSGSSTRYR